MKAIYIILTLIIPLSVDAAAFFEIYGEVKSFGTYERKAEVELINYIEIEKKSGVRYRVFLSPDTFDRLKGEKGEITLSAELKNIYGNYGKGRKFYSLLDQKKF